MQDYWRADFLEELPGEAIETFVEHAHRVTSPLTSVLLVPMEDEMGSRRVRSAFDPDKYDPAEPEHQVVEQERHGVLENGQNEPESTRIPALLLEIHSLPERVAVSL